jgi:hypothetical protein
MRNRKPPLSFRLALALALLLVACAEPEIVPTIIPTAAPFIPATNTPPPPPQPIAGAATATPTPDAASATTPRPTSTPVPVSPIVSITNRQQLETLVAGSEITVNGLAQRNASDTVWVTLVGIDRRILLDVAATVSEGGGATDTWQATLTVPLSTLGPAQLQASLRNEQNQALIIDLVPVELVLDAELTDRYITLNEPAPGALAYAGSYLYLAGSMNRPAGGLITMALLTDACGTIASRQSFGVRSGGSWYGYLLVPTDVAGPACLVASFGEPGAETWRRSLRPLEVIPYGAADAPPSLQITGPAANATAPDGATFTVSGLAFNTDASAISISVVLDNGLLLAQANATIDEFGYWEASIGLPPGVTGNAAINVSVGEGLEAQRLLTIE